MTPTISTTGLKPEPGTFGHPRPQLQREWTNLNGQWDFAIDADAKWTRPANVKWTAGITVPYAPETPASGIAATGFFKACWYKRAIDRPQMRKGERALLHFGAVDYHATVWVNGHFVCEHEGGYTPFVCDITAYLRGKGAQTIVLRAYDDPLDMEKPRGKQDWKRDPHAIWYPRTSGIWQTVWMEVVPATSIDTVRWSSSVSDWCLQMEARIHGDKADAHVLRVTVKFGEEVLANDFYSVKNGTVDRNICLPDPGIGDARNEMTWHPDHPHLFDVSMELLDSRGRSVDEVSSYCAMRELAWDGERVSLNGDVIRMRMALDQGYWLDTGLTGDDAQQKRDVELAKEAGLNGVRKHQKVEDPRYLYWADRLGLLVWEEMPSAYAFSPTAMRRKTAQWMEVLKRDFSHPCIVAYVPINESWMVPDLPLSAEQRNYVRSLFFLTKAIDPTRPVVCNSGWEAVLDADIITVHDYDSNPASFAARYADLRTLFAGLRPGGKALLLDEAEWEGKVLGVDEFGGIKFDVDKKDGEQSWGYSEVHSAADFEQKYGELIKVMHDHPRISIWCWTQLTDTYQEKNGIYTMARASKANIERVRHLSWGWR
jgi:beta-galactosidase/beta-glucuronidase